MLPNHGFLNLFLILSVISLHLLTPPPPPLSLLPSCLLEATERKERGRQPDVSETSLRGLRWEAAPQTAGASLQR